MEGGGEVGKRDIMLKGIESIIRTESGRRFGGCKIAVSSIQSAKSDSEKFDWKVGKWVSRCG